MFFRTVKKIWTDFSSVLSQCTRLTDEQTDRRTRTDGRTDRNLIARPRLHSMQRGKNVATANAFQLEAADSTPVLVRFIYDAMPSLKSLNLSTAVL